MASSYYDQCEQHDSILMDAEELEVRAEGVRNYRAWLAGQRQMDALRISLVRALDERAAQR